MGLCIDRDQFDEEDFTRFGQRLIQSLKALKHVVEQPGFGVGPLSIGAELELSIINSEGRAYPINRTLLNCAHDEHLQLELDRFNLEYNLSPVALAGHPFSHVRAQLANAIQSLEYCAQKWGGRIAPIGILPTLCAEELDSPVLSDLPRYRALSAGLRRLREGPFAIHINGPEPLTVTCPDVTLEGATTSFQIHLRVNPQDFAQVFNAAQLVTPVALALGANSPIFLQHRLWEETRVALFKQAIDSRKVQQGDWHQPARVSFGHGWVRRGAYELFAEAVALHSPLLPVMSSEEPMECLSRGQLPQLEELRLHQGTVWRWNRAIYDAGANGHFRVEFRSLPSGPTPIDMAANAAFVIGLTLGTRQQIEQLLHQFPFEYAHRNFYRAAEYGMEAMLVWPGQPGHGLREISVCDLAGELLPVAEKGLEESGVEKEEIHTMLNVIRGRLETRMNGARWQVHRLEQYESRGHDRPTALTHMLEDYLRSAHTGSPVSHWSLNPE
ncbi:glutamate--cysteine ligase [Nitrospira sp. T9]|uniref:glutamate--cysteine ligase n=1 Tax=unclassified Nitrospira TaxID=2652172 RepID=UPI003F96CFE7